MSSVFGHPLLNDLRTDPFRPVQADLSIDKTPPPVRAYSAASVARPDRQAPAARKEMQLPIRRFLAGQAFQPELIAQMSDAFVRACEALRLELVDDPATRLVASKIIEFAERGLKDAETLLEMTLREFEADRKGAPC